MSYSLISAFVICLLESIISKHATSEILIVELVSLAEETGLSLALSEPRRKECGYFMCFFLSCGCYVFVRVCLFVLCGHLLGKG